MGDWNLTISGTGQHHNSGDPKDADVLADEIVRKLTEAGQTVRHAEFVSGAKIVLPTNDGKLG